MTIRYTHKDTGQVCEFTANENAAIFLRDIADPDNWALELDGEHAKTVDTDATDTQNAGLYDVGSTAEFAQGVAGILKDSTYVEPAQNESLKGAADAGQAPVSPQDPARSVQDDNAVIGDIARECWTEIAAYQRKLAPEPGVPPMDPPAWADFPQDARDSIVGHVEELVADPAQTAEARYMANDPNGPPYSTLPLNRREADDIFYTCAKMHLEQAGLIPKQEP